MATRETSALATPAWLEAHQGDPQVRLIEIAGMGQEEMQAYRVGHVPGATCWPWKETLWDSHARDFPSPDEFARRLAQAGIGNDTTVVFYGEGMQFGIYAWWTFRYCGHPRVKVLDGGRERWRAEGRALTTEVPLPVRPAHYEPVKRHEAMRIHRDAVLRALGGERVILDARSHEEYAGTRVGAPGGADVGALRYGRIPGARHMFYEDFLNTDKSFKRVDEIRALVEARGAKSDNDIIAYCRMSHRATVVYFTLTELLGYRSVQVYDGSWTEWGNLVGVPIER